MKDCDKTKEQLISELIELRQQLDLLKQSEYETRFITGEHYFKYQVQAIIDALPFYVLLIDKNHNILLANKAVRDVLKVDQKNIIGKYCPRIIHGLDAPIPECPLEEAVLKGYSVEREYFDNINKKWIRSCIYPSEYKTQENDTVYFHMVQDITEEKNNEIKLRKIIDKLHQISGSIVKAFTTTVEKRDPYTAGHQLRVSKLAEMIAKEMSMSDNQIESIIVASLVHDIGKIAIPIEILSKPGAINIHEFNIIKTHPEVGYEILKEIKFPWPIAKIVLQHHERINGSGYPSGLKSNDILLEAKIISVADIVEAMSSHRPYRHALSLEDALNHIKSEKGNLYDTSVVNACLKVCSNGAPF